MNRVAGNLDRTKSATSGEQTRFLKHNPSAWGRRLWISSLAFLAFLIAGYMALFQWGVTKSVWDPVFAQGSERVLTSKLSEQMHNWIGIPDAALGALAYLCEIILGLAGSSNRWKTRPWIVMAFGLNLLLLVGSSLVLVVFQGKIVGSWCFLCLVTATISVVLVIMAFHEIIASSILLWLTWRRHHDRRLFGNTLWRGPSSREADSH